MVEKTLVPTEQQTSSFSLLEIDTTGFHAVVIKLNGYRDEINLAQRLTQAETAVAQAAVAGLSNREIALLRSRQWQRERTRAVAL